MTIGKTNHKLFCKIFGAGKKCSEHSIISNAGAEQERYYEVFY